jgi:predicted Zn-dependent protease
MMIMRSLLAYQRAQEEQADRAGVNFLNQTGQSPKGMYETFKRFADQQLFAAHNVDPYLQSHPMASERIAALEGIARNSPYWDKKDPPELQMRHDMMRAKLFGFIDGPDTLSRRYPLSNTSAPARYARAISAYRHTDVRGALTDLARPGPDPHSRAARPGAARNQRSSPRRRGDRQPAQGARDRSGNPRCL